MTTKRMGRPTKAKVEGRTVGYWRAQLTRVEDKLVRCPPHGFARQSMLDSRDRYEANIAECERLQVELDAERAADLAASDKETGKASCKSRPTPAPTPEPAGPPPGCVETPYGYAYEGLHGQLMIRSPQPAKPEWRAWCDAHGSKHLRPFTGGTYFYDGPVIVDELPAGEEHDHAA